MIFGRHETFYLREGWIPKIFHILGDDPNIFSKREAAEVFGVGNNMVAAIKYWGLATGIIYLDNRDGGKYNYKLSHLGEIIKKNDPHIELLETVWLLHSKIISDKSMASTWFWLFNVYENDNLMMGDFPDVIKLWIIENHTKEIAKNTLNRDLLCLIQTYGKISNSYDLENNLVCPLSTLDILERTGNQVKIKRMREDSIPLSIFEFVLYEYLKEKYSDKGIFRVNIRDLLFDVNSPGRVLRCDSNGLISMLMRVNKNQKIKKLFDRIRIVTTAGLDEVEVVLNQNVIEENPKFHLMKIYERD